MMRVENYQYRSPREVSEAEESNLYQLGKYSNQRVYHCIIVKRFTTAFRIIRGADASSLRYARTFGLYVIYLI